MPSFNDDHLGFSGPELNGVNAINITAAGGKPFSLHNAVSFQSTATMAHLPVDDTVTRAVGAAACAADATACDIVVVVVPCVASRRRRSLSPDGYEGGYDSLLSRSRV